MIIEYFDTNGNIQHIPHVIRINVGIEKIYFDTSRGTTEIPITTKFTCYPDEGGKAHAE